MLYQNGDFVKLYTMDVPQIHKSILARSLLFSQIIICVSGLFCKGTFIVIFAQNIWLDREVEVDVESRHSLYGLLRTHFFYLNAGRQNIDTEVAKDVACHKNMKSVKKYLGWLSFGSKPEYSRNFFSVYCEQEIFPP